jgi:hypothetical protein
MVSKIELSSLFELCLYNILLILNLSTIAYKTHKHKNPNEILLKYFCYQAYYSNY